MSNTSATGGPLADVSTVVDDDALEDFLQGVVAGLTGIDGAMVRPRFQLEPVNIPPVGADWAAVGIIRQTGDTNAWQGFNADQSYGVTRHEEIDLMCSFYGPHAAGNAIRLRDALALGQNREPLFLAAIGVVGIGDVQRAPQLIKERWLNRYDLTLTLRRQVARVFPVLPILTGVTAVRS